MTRPRGEWREWFAIALVFAGVIALLLLFFTAGLRISPPTTDTQPTPTE